MKHIKKVLTLSISILLGATSINAQETFVSAGYANYHTNEFSDADSVNVGAAYIGLGIETPVLNTDVVLLPQVKLFKGVTSDDIMGHDVELNHAISLEMPIAYKWNLGLIYLNPAMIWVVENAVNGYRMEDGAELGMGVGCAINVTDNSYIDLEYTVYENLEVANIGLTYKF